MIKSVVLGVKQVNINFRRSPLMFWLTSLSIFSCVTVLFPIHGINAEINSSDFTKQSSKKYTAQQLKQLYDRAIKKFNGEDYEGAIADLTRVIEQNPSFDPAYDYRGVAKYRLKRYQGAIADFSEAIRINPRDVQYQNNRRAAQDALNSTNQRVAQDALQNTLNANQRAAQDALNSTLAALNSTLANNNQVSNQQIQQSTTQNTDQQSINQNTDLPQKQFSQDCIDLTIMTKLAKIGEGDAESIKTIKQLRFNACDLGLDLGSGFNYPNGGVAKWSNGGWNYPDGGVAKWSNGGWNYPNGGVAQWSNGGWNYPNGGVAKWSNGGWNYPNGGVAGNVGSLITYACSKLDEQVCSNRLSDFKSMDTFFQDLTAIELAWLAYKTEQKRN